MPTEKYDLDLTDLGVTGWNAILKGSIEDIDDFMQTRLLLTCGETLVEGDWIYISGGKAMKAQAVAGKCPAWAMMIEGGNLDDEKRAVRVGPHFKSSGWTWTPDAHLWLDATTAGAMTETKPAAFSQRLAVAESAATINIQLKDVSPVHYGTADPPTPTGYEDGIVYFKHEA